MKIQLDEGLHSYMFQALKIEHTNQNKGKCKLLCFGFFFLFHCFESMYSKKKSLKKKIELCKFASKLIMFNMAYCIIDYKSHIIFCCHCVYLKLVQGSLVVEWCFECSCIHEPKTKGRKEPYFLLDV
jgi:hypothetical protein